MANIIAFEGIPGAGKTTAINTLLKNGSLFNCAVVPELYMGKLDSLSGSKSYLDAEIDKSSIINDTKNHYDNILFRIFQVLIKLLLMGDHMCFLPQLQ